MEAAEVEMPMTPAGLPALVDAARQQSELVVWVAQTLATYGKRFEILDARLNALENNSSSNNNNNNNNNKNNDNNSSSSHNNNDNNHNVSRAPSLLQGNSSPLLNLGNFSDTSTPGAEPQSPNWHVRPWRRESAESRAGGTNPVSRQSHTRSRQSHTRSRSQSVEPQHSQQSQNTQQPKHPQQPAAKFGDAEHSVPEPPVESHRTSESSPQLDGDLVSDHEEEEELPAPTPEWHDMDLDVKVQEALDAVSDDVDRRLDNLASYTQGELQRFADTILGGMESRLGEAIRQRIEHVEHALPKLLHETLSSKLDSSLTPVTSPNMSSRQTSLGNAPLSSNQDTATAEVAATVRLLHADVKRRLAYMEEALLEVKQLRLQVPDIQNDLERLSHSVNEMVQRTDYGNEGRFDNEPGASYGARPRRITVIDQANNRTSVIERKPSLSSVVSQYSARQHKLSVAANDLQEQQLMDRVHTELEKLESGGTAKVGDLEQTVAMLEQRLKTLEAESRSFSKKISTRIELHTTDIEMLKDEECRLGKTWNLSNQVEVIQSVINQEMRAVRSEVDQLLKSSNDKNQKQPSARNISGLLSPDQGSRSSERKDADLEQLPQLLLEVEEKIKRLQDCYQQSTLKIAGLKSAIKHSEQQTTGACDKIKKLADEMEALVDRGEKHQARLEYLTFHSNRTAASGRFVAEPAEEENIEQPERQPSTFQAVVGLTMAAAGIDKREAPRKSASRDFSKPGPRHSDFVTPVSKKVSSSRRRSQGSEASFQEGGTSETPTLTAAPADVSYAQEDLNTSRIWRLAKKISDLDGDVNAQFKSVHEQTEGIAHSLNLMISFLPRRHRRLVERLLHKTKENDHDDDKEDRPKRRNPEARIVSFSDKPVEVRTFEPNEDSVHVPWQCVGEPDRKWSWCFQPPNEMSRDLARHLQQIEEEKEEFENEVKETMARLRHSMGGRYKITSPEDDGHSNFEIGDLRPPSVSSASAPESPSGGVDKLAKRMEKVVVPHMATLAERVDKLSADLANVKKMQESHQSKKVDKTEFELVAMRLATLDKFDHKQFEHRLEAIESGSKKTSENVGNMGDQLHKLESMAAYRTDVTNLREEMGELQTHSKKLSGDLKDSNSSAFRSNRQVSQMIAELRSTLEKSLFQLDQEKVGQAEYGNLLEKVSKLEGSMRDNRQILSDASGNEVNTFVKRIILNMEDKIMVLEKKVDCLIEGRSAEADTVNGDTGASCGSRSSPQQEAAVHALNIELTNMNSAVQQLKQELQLNKVDIEHIAEQGQQYVELAQRLNVIVESTGGGGIDEGVVLSMNRVQVMIAAAARQLVAGSKWVTKDTFDTRILELRKEYQGSVRPLQDKVEELSTSLAIRPSVQGQGGVAMRLPRVSSNSDRTGAGLGKRGPGEQAEVFDWPGGMSGDPIIDKVSSRFPRAGPPGSAPAGSSLPRASPRRPVGGPERPGSRSIVGVGL